MKLFDINKQKYLEAPQNVVDFIYEVIALCDIYELSFKTTDKGDLIIMNREADDDDTLKNCFLKLEDYEF